MLLVAARCDLGVFFAVWGSRAARALDVDDSDALSLDLTVGRPNPRVHDRGRDGDGILFWLAPAWRSEPRRSAGRDEGARTRRGRRAFALIRSARRSSSRRSRCRSCSSPVRGCCSEAGGGSRTPTRASSGRRFSSSRRIFAARNVADDQRAALYRQILERLRALPGVRGAGTSQITPISGSAWNNGIKVDGFVPAVEREGNVVVDERGERRLLRDDGHAAARRPRLRRRRHAELAEGRDHQRGDGEASSSDAEPPSGNTFSFQQGQGLGPPIEIVGVVGNAKYRSLRELDEPIVYLPREPERRRPRSACITSSSYRPMRRSRSFRAIKAAIGRRSTRASRSSFTTLEQQVADSMPLDARDWRRCRDSSAGSH